MRIDGIRNHPTASAAFTEPAPVLAGPGTAQPAMDRRLRLLGGACVALSIIGILLRTLHVLPQSAASGISLAAVAIGLRILLMWSARSAEPIHRARVLNVVSLAGLAISGLVLLVALPRITRAGGAGMFFSDAFGHGWTLVIVMLAAGTVRTMTWRVYLGAGLTGLLAISATVRFVGVPIVKHFGADSLFAGALLIPAIEELLKSLLVVLVVCLAARRRDVRPSALDLTLLGLWIGAGYALYEDAQFGRGDSDFGASPFSPLFPTLGTMPGSSQVSGGHLMYTGVIGLGLAVGVLYRRRWRHAWLAVPLTFLVALATHVSWNGQAIAGSPPAWVTAASVLSLDGYLLPLLLIGGIASLVVVERRGATRAAGDSEAPERNGPAWLATSLPRWLWLGADESGRRAAALAQLQCAPAGPHRPSAAVPDILGGQS